MNADERPLVFACRSHRLMGVLTTPAEAGPVGMVIVVGGPQYRAGSHRQFVSMARAAAAAGIATLRFDVRGMGDSEGEPRSFEALDDDIAAAIDALCATVPQVERVVLWGLCDGASAALLYLDRPSPDRRVAGLCLLNPWARSDTTLARTHVRHYYADRLRQPAFWRKLLLGGVAGSALRDLLRNLRLAAAPAPPAQAVLYTTRMARAWQRFDGALLLVLCGKDLTAAEFLQAAQADAAWRGALSRRGLDRIDLPGADHTLSTPGSQAAMEKAVLRWLGALAATAPTGIATATTPAGAT